MLLCLLMVCGALLATALPPAYTRTDVIQAPGAAVHPVKSVAIARAQSAPLPAPTIVYSPLPTNRINTGTKVTVHYEPIEQYGYVVRY